jgi:hypothetical protein
VNEHAAVDVTSLCFGSLQSYCFHLLRG